MNPIRRLSLVFAVLGLFINSAQARALINEVHIDPPGGNDASHQYVEILTVNDDTNLPESQSLDDLAVVFIDSNGGNVGNIEESLVLDGLSTGANGLLLIGIGFDQSIPWDIAPDTAVADFDALKDTTPVGEGDIGPKAGMTVILVDRYRGNNNADIDANDDGNFNQSTPWRDILDSVGYGDGPFVTKLDVTISPENLSRSAADTTPNSVDAWYGGNILDTEGITSLTYDDPFGPFTGVSTPGAPNLGPPAENPIRINEVLINPQGEDGNIEFIELASTSGTITGTDGLWLLILDSDDRGAGVGEVLEAWDLSGQNTGINGLMVIGNNYTRAVNPWKDIIDRGTTLFEPSGMGDEDIGSNSGFTLLLVKGFTGQAQAGQVAGDDLDTNDDGQLDARPWDTSQGNQGILDSIGFAALNEPINDTIVRNTYALADVTPSGDDLFHPDSVSRKPGDFAANSASSWIGGNIGGNSPTGIAYSPSTFFGDFRGQVSPGLSNANETAPQSLILINEVHLDPVAAQDIQLEYIELISPTRTFTPLQDLWLLIVDVDGAQKGEIREAFDLRGTTTGSNGLMLIGDGYDTLSPYGSPNRTHREDPAGLDTGDIGPENNESLGLLLVDSFTGAPGTDIDTDDDGSFDVSPWENLMDSVTFGAEFVQTEGVANLNGAGFIPDSVSRMPSNFSQNDANAWYGGTLLGPDNSSLIYDRGFGPFQGQASPGQFNFAAPPRTGDILINEVHVNPPGNDDNFEYVELIATAGGRQSTNGLSLVVLENAGNNVGEVLEIWNLDGLATGTNGLLLLGNDYTPSASETLVSSYWDRSLYPDLNPQTPFPGEVNEAISAVGDPLDLGNDNIGPNDSLAILLVSNLQEANLPPDNDLDAGDDGVLDSNLLPWDKPNSSNGVLDGVGFVRFDDQATPPAFDGKVLVDADLSQEMFVPDNVSRKIGNFNANDGSAWFGGDISGVLQTGLDFSAEFFGLQAAATPGQPNGNPGPGATDDDGDGVSNDEEAIAGTDPNNASDYFRLVATTRSNDGVNLQWTSVNGKSYTIEYSPSLAAGSWIEVTTVNNATETITSFLDNDAGRSANEIGFYRVRVSN